MDKNFDFELLKHLTEHSKNIKKFANDNRNHLNKILFITKRKQKIKKNCILKGPTSFWDLTVVPEKHLSFWATLACVYCVCFVFPKMVRLIHINWEIKEKKTRKIGKIALLRNQYYSLIVIKDVRQIMYECIFEKILTFKKIEILSTENDLNKNNDYSLVTRNFWNK